MNRIQRTDLLIKFIKQGKEKFLGKFIFKKKKKKIYINIYI